MIQLQFDFGDVSGKIAPRIILSDQDSGYMMTVTLR
jgi:hypothetical protein